MLENLYHLLDYRILVLIIVYLLYRNIGVALICLYKYTKQGLKIDYYFPVLGYMKQIRQNQIELGDPGYQIKQKIRQNPEARIYLTNLHTRAAIFLYDPKLIQEFLTEKWHLYERRLDLYYNFMKLIGKGLLLNQGQEWRNQRKIISKAFHFDFLQQLVPHIIEITQEHLDSITDEQMNNIFIMDKFQSMTGDTICRMFFGVNFSKELVDGEPITTSLTNLMQDISLQSLKPIAMIFGPKVHDFAFTKKDREIKQKMKYFRDLAKKVIEDRKNKKTTINYEDNTNRKDLLQVLLEQGSLTTAKNLEKNENTLSDEDLIHNFNTFFFVGMDTTGHLITALMYFLCENPQVYSKLYEEIKNFDINDKSLKVSTLNSLSYLDACLKESLRLIPPVSILFPRVAAEDHYLGDIKIYKATSVVIRMDSICFGPAVYNQEEFIPERWLDSSSQNINPFSYVPFSAGPRNCIGQHLAQIEAKIISIMFLKTFTFTKNQPTNFRLAQKVLFEFETPLQLKLKRINSK